MIYKDIGSWLGVSTTRARQMVLFAYREREYRYLSPYESWLANERPTLDLARALFGGARVAKVTAQFESANELKRPELKNSNAAMDELVKQAQELKLGY